MSQTQEPILLEKQNNTDTSTISKEAGTPAKDDEASITYREFINLEAKVDRILDFMAKMADIPVPEFDPIIEVEESDHSIDERSHITSSRTRKRTREKSDDLDE